MRCNRRNGINRSTGQSSPPTYVTWGTKDRRSISNGLVKLEGAEKRRKSTEHGGEERDGEEGANAVMMVVVEEGHADERSGGVHASTPLSAIVQAFEEIADFCLESSDKDGGSGEVLRLDKFCSACSLVSVLFGCLGIAFKFAEMEYVAKVRDLVEASKKQGTLQNILDLDVANGTVRTPGSHTRNLRRVRQGLDLIRALFEQFLSSTEHSLKEAASTAYTQVCAPYHTWAVRTAVYAGMYTLPTRDQLLLKLHETDKSAEKRMRAYIKASIPVIQYIDKLYISRNISLDW